MNEIRDPRADLEGLGIKIDFDVIQNRMFELQDHLGYRFQNIWYLADAMCAINLNTGKKKPDYHNSALATLGDTVYKMLITEHLYNKGFKKGDISKRKESMESNDAQVALVKKYGISDFAFNRNNFAMDNPPENEQLPNNGHDLYFEAIVGAIYLDAGIDGCRDWFNSFFSEWLRYVDSDTWPF